MTGTVVAVDLGATSGRVISGRVNANSVSLHQNARFANTPVSVWAGERAALYWNILELWRGVLGGLRDAVRDTEVATIGVDSWAVDYALLRHGSLLGLPHHYRDERTAAAIERTHALVSPAELYARGGLQFLPFNTLYQLGADRDAGRLELADGFLQIPDLLGLWLTGEHRAELTNASTTGLLDVRTRTWDTDLAARLGLPSTLFPELIAPGERVGTLLDSVRTEIGAATAIPVLAVASHDTASAIVAIPSTTHDFAFISSGTWSLVGLELDAPVLTEASRAANFTNEGGVDGTVRYLKNVSGMWLVSECLAEWERAGSPQDLTELLGRAAALPTTSIFDPDHATLTPAGPMTRRIAARCAVAGVPVPGTPAEFVRAIVDSLAVAYAETIEQACALSGTRVRSVHVVGGGSQNALLCQLTADHTGLPVIAGPVEGTAMGNVLIQARGAGLISGDLETLRATVQRSTTLTRYQPR